VMGRFRVEGLAGEGRLSSKSRCASDV
jgi:hypothetical protein